MSERNYIDEIAMNIYRLCQEIGDPSMPPAEDMPLWRVYALLALSTGIKTTSRHVHDAWSAWQSGIFPEHRSLIPFEELTPEVQAYDDKYRDAIRVVAARRAGMMSLDDGTKVQS